MSSEGKCDLCGGKLLFKEMKDIAGVNYMILKCEKCNKQIARQKG